MSKDTLKSLSSVALAASSQAKTEAQTKVAVLRHQVPDARLKAAKIKKSPSSAPTDAANGRLNLYLTGADQALVKELRVAIAVETGEAASANVVFRTALRCINRPKLAETAKAIIAEDGRRKS